ncbi:hypothetical protein FRC00_001557 [Tulasnella sp. 408]|nr:hypothetical protein FRC00_001557 [Tulasnella sp. 408]
MALQLMKYAVYGRVQGVYFRDNAVKQARAVGVAGWVQNNLDGSVGGEAIGKPENLAKFQEWLNQGPPSARVEDLKTEHHDIEEDHFYGHFERRKGRGVGPPAFTKA